VQLFINNFCAGDPMAFVCVSNLLCRVSYFQMVSATIHAYVGFIIILQSVSVVIRTTSLKTAMFNVCSLRQSFVCHSQLIKSCITSTPAVWEKRNSLHPHSCEWAKYYSCFRS